MGTWQGGPAGRGEPPDETIPIDGVARVHLAKERCQDECVRLRERVPVLVLEHLSTGGRRARLEERPDPSAGEARPSRLQRPAHCGRMMREVVHEENPV